MTDDQLTLADEAHARRTDPGTSHAAARSVENLRPRQLAILETLRRCGPLTDEGIAMRYVGPLQSPSGMRTRRRELVDAGLVEDTGERSRTRAGRSTILWGAT